jgi:hypothetical protein
MPVLVIAAVLAGVASGIRQLQPWLVERERRLGKQAESEARHSVTARLPDGATIVVHGSHDAPAVVRAVTMTREGRQPASPIAPESGSLPDDSVCRSLEAIDST